MKPMEPENEKIVPVSMEPIQVTVIGSGTGTGDGGSKQLIETPPGQPDYVANFVTPLTALSVRFIETFLTILLSLLGTGIFTNLVPITDFADLVRKYGTVALTGAVLGLLKDLTVIFGKLKQRHPLFDV